MVLARFVLGESSPREGLDHRLEVDPPDPRVRLGVSFIGQGSPRRRRGGAVGGVFGVAEQVLSDVSAHLGLWGNLRENESVRACTQAVALFASRSRPIARRSEAD